MKLKIKLVSDTTFGRGDGVIGKIDSEVEHDAVTGMPFVKGRTIKGLLVESCADNLFSLKKSKSSKFGEYFDSAKKMFGQPGNNKSHTGCLHIGSAQLADDLQNRIRRSNYSPTQILEGLTTIRYQTAIDTKTDRPDTGSLRATRALIRDTIFYSELLSNQELDETDKALLSACAVGMQRAGQSRTRGRGRIEVSLDSEHDHYLSKFIESLKG